MKFNVTSAAVRSAAAAFLSSEGASFVTGTLCLADGGISAVV